MVTGSIDESFGSRRIEAVTFDYWQTLFVARPAAVRDNRSRQWTAAFEEYGIDDDAPTGKDDHPEAHHVIHEHSELPDILERI